MDEERARARRAAQRGEELDRRQARPGQVGGVHTPDLGDVLPGLRVVDQAVAGELVRLLAVLPPALSVPWPVSAP